MPFPYSPPTMPADGFPFGPWSIEPNSAEWESHGFSCCILRTKLGHLCGYVGVPEGHPAYGTTGTVKVWKKSDKPTGNYLPGFGYIENGWEGEIGLNIHGGITFGQKGDFDDLWWLGFDCAHSGDLSPEFLRGPKVSFFTYGTYRDWNYVTGEINSLAKQLAEFPAKLQAQRP